METSAGHIKSRWLLVFAVFFFFFNTFALPLGLTYTLLLTPIWLFLAYTFGKTVQFVLLLLPLFIYACIHMAYGVVIPYYIISFFMLCCMILFLIVAREYIRDPAYDWDDIFRKIALLNFIFTLLSLLLLPVPFLKPLVWYMEPVSKNIEHLPRLKLFASEASHYSFLFAPIAIYFMSRMLFFKTAGKFVSFMVVLIPLALSFSFSVIGDLLITGVLILLIYSGRIFPSLKRRIYFISSVAALGLLLFLLSKFYADNPVFVRIANIFSGDDTSARGRTYEAFIIANKIVAQKSYWWGIGLGQLKLIGRYIILFYYQYNNIPDVIRVPNASAETIIYFGYVGFVLRLLIELFLFIKTKLWRNPFRLWVFLFVFIYQFSGSYITNVSEYLIWIIAFSPMFADFVYKKPDNA